MAVLEAVLNQEIAGTWAVTARPGRQRAQRDRPRTVVTEVTLEPMMFSKFVRVVLYE